MYIFVYGTILSGMRNNHRVKGCRLVGKAETTKEFYMSSLITGCYPMVSLTPFHSSQKPTTIKGEVYEINEKILQDLDYLEGHPNFYTRQSVEVKILGPQSRFDYMNVFCYIILQPDVIEEVKIDYEERSEAVNDGDWKSYYLKMDEDYKF